MAIDTVASLIETLRGSRLLTAEQVRAISQGQNGYTDPRALARELLQRGWLTPYQVNQLFQGLGRELVLGQYVLLERLGEGGMGYVYKARHLGLDKIVALKVIRKDRLTNAEAVGRFQREIQLVAQLAHPNVVLAYDAYFAKDSCYLSMEYVEGIDLTRLVKQQGPLPVAQACEYIRQGALGLQHAHERSLVHRDIKPSNFLVTADGKTVKLLDLGLARLHQTEDDGHTFTQMGILVGTPDFIAPEQARNAHMADIRADLYSLGCTLYWLLTGTTPFAGKTATEKLFSHCFEQPRPVEELRQDVPTDVGGIVRRLMAKAPEDRYQTPAELAEALGQPRSMAPARAAAPALSAVPVAVAATVPVPVAMPATATVPQPADAAPAVAEAVSPMQDQHDESPATVVIARRRKRSWVVLNLAGGAILLGLIFLFSLLLRGGPQPSSAATWQASGPGRPPIDQLDAATIPRDERFPWQADVVAVLGKHRRRHWGAAYCAAFTTDGRRIATGGADHMVRFWDSTDLHEMPGFKTEPPTEIRALAFSPDGTLLAGGGSDGWVRIWSLAEGIRNRPPVLIRSSSNAISSLAFTPTGNSLAVGSYDGGIIRVWSLPYLEKDRPSVLRGHKGSVHSLAFSRDGQTLASAGGDGAVLLWNMKDLGGRDPIATRGHTEGFTLLAFGADGKSLASTGSDRVVRFWNVLDGTPAVRASLPPYLNFPSALAYAPNGKLLAHANALTIHVWDLSDAAPVEKWRLTGHVHDIRSLAFAPDSRSLAAAGDNSVRLWDMTSGKELGESADKKAADIQALAFTRDGRGILTAGWDKTIRLWDFGSVQPVERVAVASADGIIDALALSTDGKSLATMGWSNSLRLWDLSHGKPEALAGTRNYSGQLSSLAFSRDGLLLAAASTDTQIYLWRTAGGRLQPKSTLRGHRLPVQNVAFAPDGKKLASAGRDSSVRLWDVDSEKSDELSCVRMASNPWVYQAAFTPDGKRLVAGTSDRAIHLWDLTGTEPKELALFQEAGLGSALAYELAFAPHGQHVAAAQDGKVAVWNLASRHRTWERELPGVVSHIAFAADGRHLATVNGNGTVYLFRLPVTALR